MYFHSNSSYLYTVIDRQFINYNTLKECFTLAGDPLSSSRQSCPPNVLRGMSAHEVDTKLEIGDSNLSQIAAILHLFRKLSIVILRGRKIATA